MRSGARGRMAQRPEGVASRQRFSRGDGRHQATILTHPCHCCLYAAAPVKGGRAMSMILIGQYDSPFVRRVGIALRLYDLAFEHRPWSVFGDAERIAPLNPLRRVPTLVLDDGEVLIESGAILDHLDELAGPSRALIAERGEARRHALKVCALATGL